MGRVAQAVGCVLCACSHAAAVRADGQRPQGGSIPVVALGMSLDREQVTTSSAVALSTMGHDFVGAMRASATTVEKLPGGGAILAR